MKKYILFFVIFALIATPFAACAFGPCSQPLSPGIDVSQFQGNINFSAVKNAGIEVVYIRSSLGSDYVDPYFLKNYQNAKANGLKVGFYHAVTATTVTQAQSEARFFVSTINGTSPDCRLAMDFEIFHGLSASEVTAIGEAFLQEVEALSGKPAIIYSDTYNARTMFGGTLPNYPLWVAEYGVSQPHPNGKWNCWTGFQYSDAGRISGISGNVDLDHFTDEIFIDTHTTVPVQPHCIYYRVKPGDTLWGIAKMYHTTISEIVRLNGISNPNLIYVNEELKLPCTGDNSHLTRYVVRPGDTLWAISKRYGVSISRIVKINNIQNSNLIYPGQVLEI